MYTRNYLTPPKVELRTQEMLPFYCLLFICVCAAYNFYSGGCKTNLFMSKDNCESWKGILAVIIILHHISQQYTIENNWLNYTPLPYIGKWAVAGFFMMSGYGIVLQMRRKGIAGYRKRFIPKRLGKILPAFLLLTLLTVIIRVHEHDSILNIIIRLVRNGETPLWNSWFIFAIIYEYLCVWVSMIMLGRIKSICRLMVVCNIIYVAILNNIMGFGIYWTNSIFAFNIGMYLAIHDKRICSWNVRHLLIIELILILVIFLSNRIFGKILLPDTMLEKMNYYIETYACYLCLPIAWSSFDFSRCRLLKFPGKHSLNLYLTHGFFIAASVAASLNFFIALPFVLGGAFFAAIILDKLLSIDSVKSGIQLVQKLMPPPHKTLIYSALRY